MERLAVEQTVWINAPRERVWRAVTEAEQLEQWFAVGRPWEIPALQVGATLKFYNSDTEILTATITVLDPPRQLTLRWHTDPQYPTATLTTAFHLETENGGTRVTIREAGYETLPDDVRRQWADMASAGYRTSVETLKSLVESGS